jgi:hypothetical protein
MVAIQVLAVAAGVVSLILLAVLSMRGPRDPGAKLPGNGGAIVPLGHGDDGGGGDAGK